MSPLDSSRVYIIFYRWIFLTIPYFKHLKKIRTNIIKSWSFLSYAINRYLIDGHCVHWIDGKLIGRSFNFVSKENSMILVYLTWCKYTVKVLSIQIKCALYFKPLYPTYTKSNMHFIFEFKLTNKIINFLKLWEL